MNVPTSDVRFRGRGGVRALLAAGLVCAAGGAASGPDAGSGPAVPGREPAAVFVPAGAPTGPYPVTYFRLEPSEADTTYRLLVVPVRFPEDGVLGGGERAGIEASLNGTADLSLRGYYRAATGGGMTVEATLAPVVVAENPRTYYTVEGEGNLGYGLDPGAYPHNARRLVEEVTEKLVFAVDFRRFDNTGDGIADGLLLLNSGPPAVEAVLGPLPPDVLAAHAFTLDAPVDRGGARVFPYAVAATRDGVGAWAHEVGHLLGLTDLYIANGFCPGPGVGEWSLMATGANRAGGTDPSGLDPFSRQLLGMRPQSLTGQPVALAEGAFLRVFRPGAEEGGRYFLVERRTGEDGLGLPVPAWVVYLVDEDAGDNRSCAFPPEFHRPLVEVRAVVCPGAPCTARLDDATSPDLHDRDGTPTGLVLEFAGDAVRVRHESLPAARLERVRLSAVRDEGGPVQYLRLTLRNLDPENGTAVGLGLRAPDAVCTRDTALSVALAPGGSVTDSVAVALTPCLDPGPVSAETVIFTVFSADSAWSRSDTLAVPFNRPGLAGGVDARYAAVNLEPGRAAPWTLADSAWAVNGLAPFAHGELASPWISIPDDARLVLDHAWDLTALSPDVALDGVQVRLRRPLFPDVVLQPERGWGYTAERKTGNALAGFPVLSGAGSRRHVISLAAHAGDIARIVLRAAGDVLADGGSWTPARLTVAPAPGIAFALVPDPDDPHRLTAVTAAPGTSGVTLTLHEGPGVTTPVAATRTLPWSGLSVTGLGEAGPGSRRFTLIWTTEDGRTDAVEAALDLPPVRPGRGFLGFPYPNPLGRGSGQMWPIVSMDGDAPGDYTCILSTVAGRVAAVRRFRVDVPGTRLVPWDGRGDDGRNVPAGMYFLQVRRPDGTTNARKIVVLP